MHFRTQEVINWHGVFLNLRMTKNDFCIFYTEDDPDDQMLFKDALKRIDATLELHIQNDGAELMSKLENPPPKPRLLFLDLNMPRKGGLEVLAELHSSKKHEDLKVIVFTTSSDEKDIQITKSLGANLFVTKPQSYSTFVNAIRHCLNIDWSSFKLNNNPFVLSIK